MCLSVWDGALALDGLGPNLAKAAENGARAASCGQRPRTQTMDWTQRRSELLQLLRSDGQQPKEADEDDELGRLVERALVRQGKRRAGPSLPCRTSPDTSNHPIALYRSCFGRRRFSRRDEPGL